MLRDCRTEPLTDDERHMVRELYPCGDLDALAERLRLSLNALRDVAWRMGVRRVRDVAWRMGVRRVRDAELRAPGGVVALALQRRTPLEQAWK